MSEIKIGYSLEKNFVVADADSAKSQKSGSLDVLSTPRLVAFMEETAVKSIDEFLHEPKTTVGIYMQIDHISASSIGEKILVKAEVSQVKEAIITFDIEAYNIFKEKKVKIAKAIHKRAIVDKNRFMEKLSNHKN